MSRHISLLLALSTALTFVAGSARATGLANGSFEADALAADSFCISFASPLCASVTGWTGNLYLVNGSPQAITPQTPLPDGNQFAMLQATNSFGQSVTIATAGDYELTWWDSGRSAFIGASGDQSYDVVFDGVVIGSFATTTGSPWTQRSLVFSASAGTFTLELVGKASFAQGDDSALLDDFQLQPFVAPEPGTLALAAGALATLAAFRPRRR